jgi:serine/threonine protein phosphatase 1
MKYVVGDIHGNFKALKEVLTLSGFDYDKDKLIILGDVCDGHNKTKECVDELLKIKHRVFVVGNHDLWFANYIRNMDDHPYAWIFQGGDCTLESYQRSEAGIIPDSHKKFFLEEPVPYHEEDGMLFVHGGFPFGSSPRWETLDTLVWDRSLCYHMKQHPNDRIAPYENVFVGHTTTQLFGNAQHPLHYGNLFMLDSGGGWDGRLALMDIHTKKYWLSAKSAVTPL